MIKQIDQISPMILPMLVHRFVAVVQFRRNEDIAVKEYASANLIHKFTMTDPKGKTVDLSSEFFMLPLNQSQPWHVTRSLVNLSSLLSFEHEGNYEFKVIGKAHGLPYEQIITKPLPVKLVTGLPGIYAVTFSSDKGKQGAGFVAVLPDGNIRGGDGGFAYNGNYKVVDKHIVVKLRVHRQSLEAESIFGDLSEFELDLEGQLQKGSIHLKGSRKNKVSDKLFVILTRQSTMPLGNTSLVIPEGKSK